MWKIGDIDIKSRVLLAPMAGVSNPAYMKICEEMGLGYAVSELISAEAIVRGNKKTFDMLNGIDDLSIPVAIQLFGSNASVLARAASILVCDYGVKMIDINMGCPVPKVALRANSGSALLKDPALTYDIVRKVCDSVSVPVTVKIRSGWDFNSINAPLIARACEKAGAKAIAVHGRTRSQGYSGKADWSIIKKVKDAVNIPVIGNGDIKSPNDAKRCMEETSCDAVMIGRAALGNPWIIRDTVMYLESGTFPITPTAFDKVSMAKKHLSYLLMYKPERVAVCEMRMHVSYYLKGLFKTAEVKNELYKTTSAADFNRILDDYLKEITK